MGTSSRKHWPGPRTLDLRQQRARMLFVWASFACQIRLQTLVCRGSVTPNPLARVYRVRLEYELGASPKVWVEDPPLEPRSQGEPIPHVYREERAVQPCLYYPPNREWRPDMWLATTVMGWLLVWLSAYELWLATGTWSGGGVDHGSGTKDAA